MLDFKIEPFSIYGSYLVINYITEERWGKKTASEIGNNVACIRNIGGGRPIAALNVDGGYTCDMIPGKLTLNTAEGKVECTYADTKTILIRGTNADLRLTFDASSYGNVQAYPGGVWYVNAYSSRAQLMFIDVKSSISFDTDVGEYSASKMELHTSGKEWEFAIQLFEGAWVPQKEFEDFDKCAEKYNKAFEDFYNVFPAVNDPEKYGETDKRAAYVDWESTVEARRQLPCDAMVMSKHWMNAVWAWDHCFNAMAMAYAHPDFAFEQLFVPFYHQHETGILPDMTTFLDYIHGFTKPPVHGWALANIMKVCDMPKDKMEWFYPKLVKWTEYWFTYADWDNDGLCQYSHGNDSGWDNCSGYMAGLPIEGADLASYLSLQMETLSKMAEMLGLPEESKKWAERAENQIKLMIDHFWNGEKFLICQSGTHNVCKESDSLYSYLPLILGHRLPKDIFDTMVAGLDKFLTPYGLATENPKSEFYNPDGYWRGPIWAPPMYMIITGLKDGGREDLAKDIAHRFMDMMVKEGFAENFDALTGKNLRDPAYTWTSSVFMLLARQF